MNCCGSKEVFGNLYGFSNIVERGDARKFPYFSSSGSIMLWLDTVATALIGLHILERAFCKAISMALKSLKRE